MRHPKIGAAALSAVGIFCVAQIAWAQEEEVFELSPFSIDASEDQGYYASQSMAGGRLATDIINTGTSIEVITKDFMDDIGANDIQELLQYTTGTEIGGVLGNFTGAQFNSAEGAVNTQQAQRNPDRNSRIRGLASPDDTRNFYLTNIPADQYNTERLDINRGSNSFLFGLGSPAGLINSQEVEFGVMADHSADYASHLKAEVKREVRPGKMRWEKARPHLRNDLWDCECMALVMACIKGVVRVDLEGEE